MRWRRIERGRECWSGDTRGEPTALGSFGVGWLAGGRVVNRGRLSMTGSSSTVDSFRE
jgi:hypothetical protein